MNEQQIIKGIKKRNEYAMGELMSQYSRVVYGICYKIIGDYGTKEDIEEVVSDTFIQVWEEIHRYDEKIGTLSTWVFMLAKYKALTMKRKRQREQERTTYLHEEIASNREAYTDLMLDIERYLKSVTEKERTLFVRRFLLEEDIEELTKGMQINRSTLDTRLWRLRKAVKAFFTMEGGK